SQLLFHKPLATTCAKDPAYRSGDQAVHPARPDNDVEAHADPPSVPIILCLDRLDVLMLRVGDDRRDQLVVRAASDQHAQYIPDLPAWKAQDVSLAITRLRIRPWTGGENSILSMPRHCRYV